MDLARKLSVWYVVATPIVAGLSTLDLRIGGLNYTGYLWAGMLTIGLYLLVLNRLSWKSARGILPSWPWVAWYGFVCLSLFWCEVPTRRNVQDALQICMPIVVGLVAAGAIRTHAELRWIFAAFGVALGLLAMLTAAYLMEIYDTEWITTHMRAAANTVTLIGCVFLAGFPQRKLIPLAGWGACVLITTLTSSRIATIALLMVPIVHPYFQGRILWKVLASAAFAGLGLVLFNTQTFQEHFFHRGEGSIGDVLAGDYRDLGRFDAWSAVWDEAWRRPWFGAGVGTSSSLVFQSSGEIDRVLNDYLRVFYEQGLVGLALFLAVSGWQLLRLHRQVAASEGILKWAFTAAYLGFCAMLITCVTSNTLMYNALFMDPLFVVLGASYGAAWAERRVRPEIIADTGDVAPISRIGAAAY